MGMNNIEAILGCRKKLKLTASEYLFLWYLAFRGNDEDRDFAVRGEAWPGHLTIKAEIGLDSETVRCVSRRMTGLKILTIHDPGYKDRNSTTYIVDYTRFEAPLDSRPHPPQIEAPHPSDSGVPPLELSTPTPQIEGRTGIQQEQKKKVNGNEQKQRSSVSPFVSKPETSGETPEPPNERFEWAKKHKFWSKFTTNPKSFKTGCLDSEEFNQQFRERKQKTASRSTNPAHAGGGFLTPNPPCKNGCGRISHSVGLCWECQSEASAAKKEAENGNSALSGKKIHFASRVPSSLPNAPNGNDHEGSGFLAAKIAAQNGTAASKTPQSEGKSNSTKTTLPVASTSQRGKVPPSITTPQPCYEHGVGACNDVMWVPGCARCEAVKNFVEQYQIEKNPACHGGQDRAKEVPVPGKNISLDEL